VHTTHPPTDSAGQAGADISGQAEQGKPPEAVAPEAVAKAPEDPAQCASLGAASHGGPASLGGASDGGPASLGGASEGGT
jgi:hypothetical protein